MLLPWQLVDFKDLEPSMQSQELLKQGHLKVSSARTSILQQLLDATVACSAEQLYLQKWFEFGHYLSRTDRARTSKID